MSDTGTPGAGLERREPWHQLTTETESAYNHFRAYLAQERGRRSLRKLADERGLHVATLSDLSATHQWVARVQAHDANLDAIEEAEFVAERRRIAREAARAAGSALQAANLSIRAGILGLQPYAEQGVADEKGIVRNAAGIPVQRLDGDQALAAIRAGTRSAVAAHQLVADRIKPDDQADEAGVEEVAYGLNVFDLAGFLVELAGSEAQAFLQTDPDAQGGGTIEPDPDVIDVEAVEDPTA